MASACFAQAELGLLPTAGFGRRGWAGRIGQHLAVLDQRIGLQRPAAGLSCERVRPKNHTRTSFPRRGAPGFDHDDPNAGGFLF